MHLEDADLVGGPEPVFHRAKDAELVAALAFKIEYGIDHVLDHAGAGDRAFLGDVADEHQRSARFLGPAHQFLRAGPHLRHRAGRGLETVGPERLDRIDDDEAGIRFLQRRQDAPQVRLRRELHRRAGDLEALRPLLDLRGGFLAGDIDGFDAVAGKAGGGLQEQGGLADARIAADQRGRGRHNAAAEHAVELLDADQHAGRRLDIRVQRDEFCLRTALCGRCLLGLQRAGRGGSGLLDQCVPLAARLAPPRPLGVNGPAGLADEG